MAGIRAGILFALWCAITIGAACAQGNALHDDVNDQLIQIAGELEFWQPDTGLRRRIVLTFYDGLPENPSVIRYNEIMASLWESTDRATAEDDHSVRELLRHHNPRVRHVAMVWLYQRFDPNNLPLFYELIDDEQLGIGWMATNSESITVAMPPRDPETGEIIPPELLEILPYSVGQIARDLIDHYLTAIRGSMWAGDFPAYWDARKDRTHCISWIQKRIRQFNLPGGRVDHRAIDQVISSLDGLTELERPIYRVILQTHFVKYSREPLPGMIERELIATCREIGVELILAMLAGDPVIDDPDLPYYLDTFARFVLRRAEDILEPEQAAMLIDLAPNLNRQRGTRAMCFMAAARLEPDRAQEYIAAGLNTIDGEHDGWQRADMVATLWKYGDDDTTLPFIVEWFFAQNSMPRSYTSGHEKFLKLILGPVTVRNRRLLKTIIEDPRFGECDWSTLKAMLEMLRNEFPSPAAINTEAFLRPYTSDPEWKRAERMDPERVRRIRKMLDAWRIQLREFAASWDDG